MNTNTKKLKNAAAVWIVLALSCGSTFASEASNPTGHWKTAFYKRGQMDNAEDRGVSWNIRVEGCKSLHISRSLIFNFL